MGAVNSQRSRVNIIMAQQDTGQEKTEAATPRKREKAREEGRVAVSRDLTAGLALVAAGIAARICWPSTVTELGRAGRWTIAHASEAELDAAALEQMVGLWQAVCLRALAPALLAAALMGVLTGLAQTKLMFSLGPLKPRFDKLSPVNGFKRLISVRGMVEGAKGLLKVILVLGVAGWMLWTRREDLLRLSDCEAIGAMTLGLDLIFGLVLRCGIMLVVIGVADYAYQWWEHERSLRMTRQEVIDEMKQLEGDPHMRARRKALRRAMLQQGISREAKDATVVVTNPAHIAVALLYRPGMIAPRVVAKGRSLIARRIVALAVRYGIPVIQNVSVARALYKAASVGDYVPGALYHAVAEVLAVIYRRARERRRRQVAP